MRDIYNQNKKLSDWIERVNINLDRKISALLDIIENHKNYRPSTIEKYKIILRLFYKVCYGNNKFYTEQVNWFFNQSFKGQVM